VIVLLCLESPSPGRASRAALDLACTLAGSAKVIALSAGGPAASASLELARACASVARVIHLDDPLLDKADFLTMGMVLAEAARHLEASLVIAGERSDEEGQGLVPAALAHDLKAHLISRVDAVRVSATADAVEVRVRAGGQICTIECPLPLVLTAPPRAAGEARPTASHPASIETLPLTQLAIDASRLVPRPDLLGSLAPAPAESVREMTFEEASAALLRHR
jgi:electron transfer flavoprotein alpha/beta subunit